MRSSRSRGSKKSWNETASSRTGVSSKRKSLESEFEQKSMASMRSGRSGRSGKSRGGESTAHNIMQKVVNTIQRSVEEHSRSSRRPTNVSSMASETGMRSKADKERGRVQEVAAALAQTERHLNELSTALRNQEVRCAKELADANQELRLVEEKEEELIEKNEYCDTVIQAQEEELDSLEEAVDQMRLKFIYYFLTNKHDVGFYVDPSVVFGRLRRASTLFAVRRSRGSRTVSLTEPRDPPPNIVTPYLNMTRAEIAEVERHLADPLSAPHEHAMSVGALPPLEDAT